MSGTAWKLGPSLFLPRPGPEEQAEGQLTGEGDRQGQQKAAGSPVQGQGGNEAGSSIIVKQQPLIAYSYCLSLSLLSAGSAAACNDARQKRIHARGLTPRLRLGVGTRLLA